MEHKKINPEEYNELLEWINERFIKSMARIHCLSMINKGYKHGYEIIKHIKEKTGLEISAGALYPVLQWLEENSYIKGTWKYEEGKPNRKEYDITEKGLEVLDLSRKRLTELSQNLIEKDENNENKNSGQKQK